MIDLHCHILHGLDDGAATLSDSVAMARVAGAGGVSVVVATPHIREDFPFSLDLIASRCEELTSALEDEGIRVAVTAAGEVALTKVAELDDATLGGLCLGRGRYVLVESPYSHATGLLESTLFD